MFLYAKEVALDIPCHSFSNGFHNKSTNRFYKQNLWHIKNIFLNRYTDNAKKLSFNQGEFCITKNFVSPLGVGHYLLNFRECFELDYRNISENFLFCLILFQVFMYTFVCFFLRVSFIIWQVLVN